MTTIALVRRRIEYGQEVAWSMVRADNGPDLLAAFHRLKEQCSQGDTLSIVRCSEPMAPPVDFTPSPPRLWCPFCQAPRLFQWNSDTELRRCDICRVSTREAHVQRYNHLIGLTLGNVVEINGGFFVTDHRRIEVQ